MNELQMHIDKLLSENSIPHTVTDNELDWWYDSSTREVSIPKATNLDTYLTALHEIGHYVYNHCPNGKQTWDEEAKAEIEAWNFAYTNSIVPVQQSYILDIESKRLKGSWE